MTRFSAAAANPPVAGYIFWLDADQSLTQTLFQDENQTIPATDGSRVAAWKDKSPSGWHVSNPADVAFEGLNENWRPIYRVDQQDGKPAVRFEVHNFGPPEWDFLRTPLLQQGLQGNSYTFFVVCRRLGVVNETGQEGMLSLWSSLQEGGQAWDSQRPGGARVGNTDREFAPDIVVGDARDDKILSSHPYLDNYRATLLWCSKYTGTKNTSYLNGFAGSEQDYPKPGFSGYFNSDRIQLGAMSDDLVYPPSCYDYFEVLIYPGALSEANRVAVENYLNNKWGIWGVPSRVSLTVSAHTTQDGYLTPVQVNVIRPDQGSSELPVQVRLTSTATYGVDYILYPWDGTGLVTIPAGANAASFSVYIIPDSRVEGDETVTFEILDDPGYTKIAPVSQTITIKNDDSNQIPASGWQLIDLGTGVYGTSAYGMGINTVDGGGGRGIAVGYQIGYYGNGQISPAFKWNNGIISLLYWRADWNSFPTKWAQALAINNAGTAVGQSGHYPHSGPGGYGGYWQRPAFWRVNETSATELSVITDSQYPLNNSAVDINQRDDPGANAGVIVGNCATLNGKVHAVYWEPDGNGGYGTWRDLGDIGEGSKYSYASAINNNGVVVGRSQIFGANNYHAFRSRAANLLPLPLSSPTDDMGTATFIDSHSSEGSDINALGEMVGASDAPSGQYRAVYKSPSSGKNAFYFDLGVLGAGTQSAGNRSVAFAISAKGLIVGQSKFKVGQSMVDRAFVVSNVGNPGSQLMLNLTEQSWVLAGGNWQRADVNGWVLLSAERINREGWIVGYGTKSGQTRAYVLSPR